MSDDHEAPGVPAQGRPPDHAPAPLLRARLDRELAHLDATARARQRLRAAIAPAAGRDRAARRGPWTPRRPAGTGRWAGPLVAAAVVAVAVAVPVATAELRRSPAGSSAASSTGPAAPGTPAPSATPATSPPPAASSTRPTPTPSGARPRLDLRLRDAVVPVGRDVVVTAYWVAVSQAPSPAPSVVPSDAPSAPSAGSPVPSASSSTVPFPPRTGVTGTTAPGTPPPATTMPPAAGSRPAKSAVTRARTGMGVAVLVADWGDGIQSSQRLRCLDGELPRQSAVSFSHTYRTPGRYLVTVYPLPTSGCGADTPAAGVTVAVRAP